MKYEKLVNDILANIGGKDNIADVAHCMTRLRFKLKDGSKFNKAQLENISGVVGTAVANNQHQVIIGNQVADVYSEFVQIAGIDAGDAVPAEKEPFSFKEVVNTVAGLFTPLVPALAGSGIIKGILVLLTTYGLMSNTSGTYQILTAAADAVFYFMPLVLAYSSARRFKTDVVVSMAIGASLVYPNLVTFMTENPKLDFLGIPVIVTSYASSVIPIILSIFVFSYLERFLKRYIPKTLDMVVTPAISLAVMVPLTLMAFGPFGNYVSDLLGKFFVAVTGVSPLISGAIFGGAYPIFVMFGVHRALVPIGINEVSTTGSTSLWAFTGPSNFAQSGAAFGAAFKLKDKEMKSVAVSSAVSALFGITEPALYGINLKYKKPMIAVVAAGAIGGAIAGIGGAKAYAVAIPSLLTLPAFVGKGFAAYLVAVAVAFVLGVVFTLILGIDEPSTAEEEVLENETQTQANHLPAETVLSPLEGTVKNLSDGVDSAFASKALGDGSIIIPSGNTVVAPFNGKVSALFPTKHAIGLTSDNGLELLIHIGVDTVQLDGKGFDSFVQQGDSVEAGQKLITFDGQVIKEAGLSDETYVIVTNTAQYLEILPTVDEKTATGNTLLTVL